MSNKDSRFEMIVYIWMVLAAVILITVSEAENKKVATYQGEDLIDFCKKQSTYGKIKRFHMEEFKECINKQNKGEVICRHTMEMIY